MRYGLAALGLLIAACSLQSTGVDDAAESGASTTTGASSGSADASSTTSTTGGEVASSTSSGAITTAGGAGAGAADGGGGATSAGGGGAGGSGTGGDPAGTGSAGGGGADGGEGGAPPLPGEAACGTLGLDFDLEDITEELAGTPWRLRGDGRAESGGGRLLVEGDQQWVEIHTEGGGAEPLAGCSVTATLEAVVSVDDLADAKVSALAVWPGQQTRRRGFEIQVSSAGPCVMRFGFDGNLADADPRECDATQPITVRLRHTGTSLCYDVASAGVFEQVACVDAPMPLDVGVGASSNDAYELQYGPIP